MGMPDTEVSQAEKCRVIAEKVMGWKLADRIAYGWGDGPPVWITGDEESPTHQGFDPFNDSYAMIKVMQWVRQLPGDIDISVTSYLNDGWGARLTVGVGTGQIGFEVIDLPTPMHAVAEAAYQYALTIQ